MKKLVISTLLGILFTLNFAPIVHAIKVEDVFNPAAISDVKVTDKNGEEITDSRVKENLKYVENLPNDDRRNIISKAIEKVIFVAGALTTVAVIAAAVFYMVSMGNEDEMNKAKNILIYTIVGLIIISVSYALTIGIAKIEIF